MWTDLMPDIYSCIKSLRYYYILSLRCPRYGPVNAVQSQDGEWDGSLIFYFVNMYNLWWLEKGIDQFQPFMRESGTILKVLYVLSSTLISLLKAYNKIHRVSKVVARFLKTFGIARTDDIFCTFNYSVPIYFQQKIQKTLNASLKLSR